MCFDISAALPIWCRAAGHTVERRRGDGGAVVELLRDAGGRLLAMALPQWNAATQAMERQVCKRACLLSSKFTCAALCPLPFTMPQTYMHRMCRSRKLVVVVCQSYCTNELGNARCHTCELCHGVLQVVRLDDCFHATAPRKPEVRRKHDPSEQGDAADSTANVSASHSTDANGQQDQPASFQSQTHVGADFELSQNEQEANAAVQAASADGQHHNRRMSASQMENQGALPESGHMDNAGSAEAHLSDGAGEHPEAGAPSSKRSRQSDVQRALPFLT